MTNFPHIIETALLILVAFLVGCVIGYLLRLIFSAPATEKPAERKTASASPVSKSAPSAAAGAAATKPAEKSGAAVANADGKPAGLDAPRDGRKDNLKQIKGIGPKIEGQLNELGIFHIDQVAAWDKKTIQWVDGYLSFKGRIDREKWVPQAKELAKGQAAGRG